MKSIHEAIMIPAALKAAGGYAVRHFGSKAALKATGKVAGKTVAGGAATIAPFVALDMATRPKEQPVTPAAPQRFDRRGMATAAAGTMLGGAALGGAALGARAIANRIRERRDRKREDRGEIQ